MFDWIKKIIKKKIMKRKKSETHHQRWRYDTDGITKIPVDDF